jgi:hypothetical protein
MSLYKLFTYTQQSSYRLDYIGQLEVGLGKIEFDGTLDDAPNKEQVLNTMHKENILTSLAYV